MTDAGGRTAALLDVVAQNASPGNALQFQIFTDFRPNPLILAIPVFLLKVSKLHGLVLRDLGFRMDLHVDGVLADQEWPIGQVAKSGAHVAEQSASVHSLNIAEGVLPDSEVGRRRWRRKGDSSPRRQNVWCRRQVSAVLASRGYNTNAGDLMPFFHEGVLHVFFVLDRRHHRSEWGLEAHQWGHLSTTNLVHWRAVRRR